ncbi:MAG: threonine/serine exporter family protein [Clostridiales bacterium]|nr:threonine/serine exporter family protein [Clostridiales bacterium]
MSEIDYILDFAVNLGKQELLSGATLERVNETVGVVCHSYGLHDVSVFSLSSILIVSAKNAQGTAASRQVMIPAAGIHLERLRSLNELYHSICREKPDPATLRGRLREVMSVKEYPEAVVILGNLLATASLTFIFGGTARDALAAMVNMFVLYWLLKLIGTSGINKIISNILCTLVEGTLAILLVRIGLAQNYFIVIIANTMLIIPGIPMVNAMRNLLCGNEMNGILQFFRVLIESAALASGLVLSIYIFGGLILW